MERRQFTRILFEAEAELTQGSESWLVRLQDICLKGALVSKPAQFSYDLDDFLTLQFVLDGLKDPISMKVIVSHSGENFIGLETRNIGIESATELKTLVEFNLGDPALLERDIKALCQYH